MPRAINVQALDARFGHVLSGVVAQPQLDEWLGCEKRRRRLCRRLTDYRLGAVVPVHGTPIRFWRLTHASMRELLCRPSARVASGEPARMASVAGVEYRLREGRMLLTLKTGAPTLIREVVEAAQKQIRDDAAALKKRIKKLQSEAEAAGEQPSSELRRLVAQHEALRSRWPEPEETTARFLETANVRSVFVDPTASDGETLVFATLAANPKRYRDLFGALSRAVLPLERSARLRVLCGSPYEASVVEQDQPGRAPARAVGSTSRAVRLSVRGLGGRAGTPTRRGDQRRAADGGPLHRGRDRVGGGRPRYPALLPRAWADRRAAGAVRSRAGQSARLARPRGGGRRVNALAALAQEHAPLVDRVALLLMVASAAGGLGGIGFLTVASRPVSLARARGLVAVLAAPAGVAALLATFARGARLEHGLVAAVVVVGACGALLWRAARWVRPPEPYRQAVARADGTTDLVLGQAHLDDGAEAFNPSWVRLSEKALHTNLQVVGGIGAGKTSGVVFPLADQLLRKHASDADRRPFLLVLDVKGGVYETIAETATAAGRADDIVQLTPGGAMTCNLLADDAPAQQAARLLDALTLADDGQAHPFYAASQEAFVRAALGVLALGRGPGEYHIGDLQRFIADVEWRDRLVAEVASERHAVWPGCLDYFQRTVRQMDERDLQGILLGLTNQLGLWTTGAFGETFAVAKGATFPGWRAAIDRGLIVVVTLPENTFGEALCRRVGLTLIAGFMDAALARTDPAAPINRERLVACFIDEAQKFMSRKLANFASVSRQAGCFTCILHQNLAQIPDAYRDDIAANFRSQLVLNVSDAFTADYFHEDVQRRFAYTDIMRLGPGRGVLSLYDGAQLQPARVVRLVRFHEPGGRLGGLVCPASA
jgi:hypothetical protein